jgi:hypothetical protein
MASNIVRVEHDKKNPYLTINTTFLNDKNLTLKAKGLLGYFLSKPNDWTIMMHDLTNKHKDGRDSIYSAMKELRENGYMIKRVLKVNGKISEWESIVFETPHNDAIEIYKQQQEKRKNNRLVDSVNTVDKTPLTENPYMEKINENNQISLTDFPDMEEQDTEIPYRGNPEIILNNDLPITNLLNINKDSNTTFQEILQLYSTKIKPLIEPQEIDRLKNIYSQVSPEILVQAINLSAEQDIKHLSYIQMLAFNLEEGRINNG